MARSGKPKKTANDSTPLAPKDIKGDVTTKNELSPKDAAAPRSTRKRDGDFNDFEKDDDIIAAATEDTSASPIQPKKKSKTAPAAGKKTKQTKDAAKSAPTEETNPNGEDALNVEPAEEPNSPPRKTSRKTAGKSKLPKDEVAVVAIEKGASKKDAEPSRGKKAKPSKTDGTSKDKKEKPSKADGLAIVTEKTHPGGDMVETELAEEPTAQKPTSKKVGRKSKAEKDDQKSTTAGKDTATVEAEPAKEKEAPTKKGARATKANSSAKINATGEAAQQGKPKPDGDKAEDTPKAEDAPSQAKAVHKVSAPKSIPEPKTVDPKTKSQNSKKATNAEPEAAAIKGKGKATKSDKAAGTKDDKDEEPDADTVKEKGKAIKSGKAVKGKGKAKEDESAPAMEDDTAVAPDQAMDEAPFKNLLKRERAKIPSVKASANAAEADRKANAASKASDKAGKASKAKEPKPASKDKKTTDTEPAAEASKVEAPKDKQAPETELPAEASKTAAPKGKKRKEGSDGTDTKADSAPSGKKQKKSRPSALEAATSAVGDLVNSGMEAAAQGVSAVKDLASGLGNNSLAEDITAVAEDAAEDKSKKAKAKKGDTKKAVKADKGKGKEKPVEKEAAADDSDLDESEEDDEYEEGDQTMALIKGFESQDEDDGPSMGEGFKEGQTVPGLPSKKDVENKLKAVKEGSDEPGVVYVGRIPHGFYEPQMRAYFGQFGSISRLRLSRNRTTGNSKHYAFLEFSSSAVAKIVADTMDNYLMFGHILKCKLVAPGDVHENLWKGANKRFKKVPWSKLEGKKLEKKVGREEWGKRVEVEKKKRGKKAEKMKSIGYEFEAPKLKGPEDVPVREVEDAEKDAAVEGPSSSSSVKAIEGTAPVTTAVEEKTLVTTDGGDGSLVISEEVKTTKIKKTGGKRKAAAEAKTTEEGPLAEVVKKAKKAKKSAA
ncbi:MAG: hypothetical protein Q9168_006460 [Polycauliona sp. 1 TL-2023]